MYHIIYRSVNIINGKFYIGVHSTENVNDNYYGSGHLLLKAIRKYGKENFEKEVLGIFGNREEALYFEEELVGEELIERDDCYNLVPGGGGVGYGKNNPNFGKEFPEHSERMLKEGNPRFGVNVSKEVREKISSSHTGKTLSEEHKEKLSERLSGLKRSKETKRKISENNCKYWKGKEGYWSGKKRPNVSKKLTKKYKHIPTGKIFEGQRAAAEFLGITVGSFKWRINPNSKYEDFVKLNNGVNNI